VNRALVVAVLALLLGAAFARGEAPAASPEAHVTLVIVKRGTGTGRVTSRPPVIDCGDTCIASVPSIDEPEAEPITLTATPDPGSLFAGWIGGCDGSEPTCRITLTTSETIVAIFDLAGGQGAALAVAKLGTGTVTSAPPGIDCGSTCTATFPVGGTVTLSAAPAPGFVFRGWTGACLGAAGCALIMDGPKSVTATFEPAAPQSFALAVSVSGEGTVTSAPPGIDCGSVCTASFAAGTVVTLIARATGSETFTGWVGACSGTGPTCTLTMSAAQSAAASFGQAPPASYSLSVSRTAGGTITSTPVGIECGPDCAELYPAGAVVTLTASPAVGFIFTGWSGDCTGLAVTCRVTLDRPRAVNAGFAQAPPETYPVAVSRTGLGEVTSTPSGIACGSSCSAVFSRGAALRLTARPGPEFMFAKWTGACTGRNDCLLTIDGPKSVTAVFTEARDTTAPTVRALPSTGRRGSLVHLRYRVTDDGGKSSEQLTVLRARKVLARLRSPMHEAVPGRVLYNFATWRVPGSVRRGLLRFCVTASDAAGNRSRPSCAVLRIG